MNRARGVRVGIATIMLIATSAIQGGALPQASQPVAKAGRTGITGPRTGTGTVVGTAWGGDTAPLPQALIRLRDVETGRGVARAVTTVEGTFGFERVDPGPYVVELLSQDEKVVAVGDLFWMRADDRILTVVRSSAQAPSSPTHFGNAARAVIAAASAIGVTAHGSSGQPVSPQ
jgi:hypothetical protein